MIDLSTELIKQLTRIADALERQANGGEPTGPDLRRPISDFATFDWSSIGATVINADADGPTHVEYAGTIWTRRSPQNKFGAAIWYSRASGAKDADGNVVYLRLIKFQEITEADSLPRKAAEMVRRPAPQSAFEPAMFTDPAPVAPQLPAMGRGPVVPALPVSEAATSPAAAGIVKEIRMAMELYTRRPALTPGQVAVLPGLLESAFETGDKEAKRHQVQKAITGHLSLKEIPVETAMCLFHWLRPYVDASKAWHVNDQAKGKLNQLVAELDKQNQPSLI